MRGAPASWICYGCFIDLYKACLSLDYAHHPNRDLVQAAAMLDGLDEQEYRLRCLQHQLQMLRDSGDPPDPNVVSQEYLKKLIAERPK